MLFSSDYFSHHDYQNCREEKVGNGGARQSSAYPCSGLLLHREVFWGSLRRSKRSQVLTISRFQLCCHNNLFFVTVLEWWRSLPLVSLHRIHPLNLYKLFVYGHLVKKSSDESTSVSCIVSGEMWESLRTSEESPTFICVELVLLGQFLSSSPAVLCQPHHQPQSHPFHFAQVCSDSAPFGVASVTVAMFLKYCSLESVSPIYSPASLLAWLVLPN